MEAGGFEPPSRDVSRQASTCLVVLLFFRLTKSQTTGRWLGYFGKSYRSRPEQPARPACCLTPLPDPQAKSGRTGRQIRQPCATDSCRLKFVAGWLARPTGVLDMQLASPPSGRSRSPPYSLFKCPLLRFNKPLAGAHDIISYYIVCYAGPQQKFCFLVCFSPQQAVKWAILQYVARVCYIRPLKRVFICSSESARS